MYAVDLTHILKRSAFPQYEGGKFLAGSLKPLQWHDTSPFFALHLDKALLNPFFKSLFKCWLAVSYPLALTGITACQETVLVLWNVGDIFLSSFW